MKVIKSLLLSALLLCLAQSAYAGHDDKSEHQDKEHSCKRANIDENKDGAVSREEFLKSHQEHAEKVFTEMDANKDGKIDDAEHQAGHKKCGRHHKSDDKGHNYHH